MEQWERDHEANRKPFIAGVGCTVAALVAAHSEHARTYYRRPDGSQTSEVEGFRRSTRPLLGEEYRELPADEFKPTHLRAIREKLIGLGQCRNTINQSIGRIRRVFRWGFESDLVKQETVVALSLVKDLAEGRSKATDHEPVAPAPIGDVEAVVKHLHPILSAMVRVQLLAGPRPAEVCKMRGDEIDQKSIVRAGSRMIQLPGDVWVFQPAQFKQRHAKKIVAYVLGPQAQQLLMPFLTTDGFLFSPAKVREDARAKQRKPSRDGKRKQSIADPKRQPGSCYTSASYAIAIAKACDRAGVPAWSPGQLRHNFATALDQAAGIQLASYALGHSSIDTTQIYIERNLAAVAEAMKN